MTPFEALRNAEQFIFMAEKTKDELSRCRYEGLARQWLDEVDIEKWLEGNVSSHPLANEPRSGGPSCKNGLGQSGLLSRRVEGFPKNHMRVSHGSETGFG